MEQEKLLMIKKMKYSVGDLLIRDGDHREIVITKITGVNYHYNIEYGEGEGMCNEDVLDEEGNYKIGTYPVGKL